ncbi:MAG: hypothetical protein OXD31_11050 [Chloroflexi bacterium]|nr:hypothetical protein [Chloroflexota bacterium]
MVDRLCTGGNPDISRRSQEGMPHRRRRLSRSVFAARAPGTEYAQAERQVGAVVYSAV